MTLNFSENKLLKLDHLLTSPHLHPLSYVAKVLELYNLLGIPTATDLTLKKIKFFCYELDHVIDPHDSSDIKLQKLCDFFFAKFEVIPSYNCTHLDELLLDQILAKRRGLAITLKILFHALARHIWVDLQFVHVGGYIRLKFLDQGQSYYLNFLQAGKFLSQNEVLELMNTTSQQNCHFIPDDLEELEIKEIMLALLFQFEKVLTLDGKFSALLSVYDFILHLIPSNLGVLEKSALLKYQLGLHHECLIDLKRYSYLHKDNFPSNLKALENELKSFSTDQKFK